METGRTIKTMGITKNKFSLKLSIFFSSKNLARAKIKKIFIISEGCILTPNMLIQRLEPFPINP